MLHGMRNGFFISFSCFNHFNSYIHNNLKNTLKYKRNYKSLREIKLHNIFSAHKIEQMLTKKEIIRTGKERATVQCDINQS